MWFILYQQFHTSSLRLSRKHSHTNTHSQAAAQSHQRAQITTKQHTHTHVHVRTPTQIATPPFIQTISHLPSLPRPILWPKKNKSPCSVADSERINPSNSLKMRKFSWGYWISPDSLCSVVSLAYRAQGWMDQTLHKGTTGCQVSASK